MKISRLVRNLVLASLLMAVAQSCGPETSGRNSDEAVDSVPTAGGSSSVTKLALIASPGRSESLDLSAPILRTVVATLPAMPAGKIEEKEYDLAGFDSGGQFLVPSVRIRGGHCGTHSAGQVIFSSLYLMHWNNLGAVSEWEAVQLMTPLRLIKGGRYSLQLRSVAANSCEGASVEMDFIGLASRAAGEDPSGQNPLPIQPQTPAPTPSPVDGEDPSPPPTPTCPPHPTLATSLVMQGALSAREGCRELWRKSFDEILFADDNSCNRAAVVQSESQSGLVKVLQKRDDMFLNLFWLHGVDPEVAALMNRQIENSGELLLQAGNIRCNQGHGGKSVAVVLKNPESLLMFTSDPINTCLAKAGMKGIAALMPRAKWQDSGENAFRVSYRLDGPQPFLTLTFALADSDLHKEFVAKGRPQLSFFASGIHSYLDQGTAPLLPDRDGRRWTVKIDDPILIRRLLAHWRDLEVVLKAPLPGAADEGRCSLAARMPLGELISDSRLSGHFDDISIPGRRPASLGEHDLSDLQE